MNENNIVNIPRLIASYFTEHPVHDNAAQAVSFGTSGHRGSAFKGSFNEDHVLVISQAIADYRMENGITGPLFIGIDTHALSEAALRSCVEVMAANGVEIRLQENFGYTPTPVISHAILNWNSTGAPIADGIIITPSHNPPEDGGLKYNPPSGGPSGSEITKIIQERANKLLSGKLRGVKRICYKKALAAPTTRLVDYVRPYVDDLKNVLDMTAIAASGIKIGADPLGGSGINFWAPIAERYLIDIEVVNKKVDPTFSFMQPDHDGKIRMDCSSPYAMRGLLALKDKFDVAFGNDPDYDRHGIVTKDGLMAPNAYLAVAVEYLFTRRKNWQSGAMAGKTLVSSTLIDKTAAGAGRRVYEVPVGFKWFVEGLKSGMLGFAGEESAGASFLRKDGLVWTTDKDGLIMSLLAAEITAVTGELPSTRYKKLTERYGTPFYSRKDAPATMEQKEKLKKLSPADVDANTLAGEKITAKMTTAPGNGAAIDGLKVTTASGWFAARPSGTEDIYKIYAESLKSEEHLKRIEEEAKEIVNKSMRA